MEEITRYDIFELNWKVKRGGRTREGLDELNVLLNPTGPRLEHSEDPGHGHVVVFRLA